MAKHIMLLLAVLVFSLQAVAKAPVTIDDRLDAAVVEVTLFGFKTAYPEFKAVLAQVGPPSDQWQLAIYGAAICAHQFSPPTKGLIDEAGEFYELLIEKTPDSKFAPPAMMNLGRIAELRDYHKDVVDLDVAGDYYTKVIERWPDKPIVSEAVFRLAGTYVQTYDEPKVQKAIDLLEKWVAEHPDDPLVSAMWQYLGDTYFFPIAQDYRKDDPKLQKKAYRKSLNCYKKADAIGWIEKGREGPVWWRMAVMSERFLGDRDTAVEFYTRLIIELPTSANCYEAQLALKRLKAPVPDIIIYDNKSALRQSNQADGKEQAK